jgi:SAM-dependent methyltransferase
VHGTYCEAISGGSPLRRTYESLPISASALARIEQVVASLHGRKVEPRALADAVVELSRVYTRERGQMDKLDKRTLLARAGFFWPRDLPKVFGPLDELREAGLSPDKAVLRVLDVGAGLGATSFGLARWLRLRQRPVQTLQVVALEHNAAALRVFQAFVRAFADLSDEFVPITLEGRAEDLRSLRGHEEFDLITFGFVLNELFLELPELERAHRRASLLIEASQRLAHGGAIVLLEPALRETARELMLLRDVLVKTAAAPYVIAPCLHDLGCPMLPSERDWCHQELAYALPPALADVARAASLRYEGLRYASLVLANTERPTRPAHSYRVVSDRLASKGKLELYGCSTAGYTRLTRLDKHASADNEAFASARRGDVLSVDHDAPRIGVDTRVHNEKPDEVSMTAPPTTSEPGHD